MNTLNQVVKDLKRLSKSCKKDSISQKYYNTLVKYLLLENKYKEQVEKSNKRILHYFLYMLPSQSSFEFLYHAYNPVRYAVETFDSIEEIRKELIK